MFSGQEIGLWTLLIAAAVCDLLWGKVFNWLNFSFMAGGIASRLFFGNGLVVESLLGLTVAFVLFYPLFFIRAMAAGDVKLLMAVGAWSSPKLVVELGLIAILVGALVGGFVLIRSKGWKESFKSVRAQLSPVKEATSKPLRMPFAPAFFCAFLLVQIMQRYQWSVL